MSDDKELVNVSQDVAKLTQEIMAEGDPTKAKNLIDLFNWNITKKNAVRMATYDKLLDEVSRQMLRRITEKPDEFSHKELIDYLNAVSASMDKAQQSLQEVDSKPVIQVQNNTQVNVNMLDSYDKDSQERVMDAVKAIMASLQNAPQDNTANTIEADAIDEKELNDESNAGQ